jgi:hypothetical protein
MIIETIEHLIEALGGSTRVAEWAGMADHSGVSQWISRGVIPSGWHLRLYLQCCRRGLSVDWQKVLGLTAEEADLLERNRDLATDPPRGRFEARV